jgi:hypothetical protein
MTIKFGDKVKIKDTVKTGETYNGYHVNDEMVALKGKELTISRISTEETEEGVLKTYMVKESPHGWTDDIIERAGDCA